MYLKEAKRLYTLDGKGRPEHVHFVTRETTEHYVLAHMENWTIPKDTLYFNGTQYYKPTEELDLLYMGKLMKEFTKSKDAFEEVYHKMRDIDNKYVTIDWETLSEDFNIFLEDINDFYESYIIPKVGKE